MCCTYAERVAFPDDILTEEEEVVLHLHPHWRTAVRPILVLTAAFATTLLAWVMLPNNNGGHIGVGVVGVLCLWFALRRGVWPLMVWRCTHYVLTDERILMQEGVLSRERRDLPLNRINDHLTSQSVLDRMFGSGTVRVDSIGDQAAEMVAVPHVHQVQTTLYELIEASPDDEEDEDEEVSVADERPSRARTVRRPDPRALSTRPVPPPRPSRRSLPRGRPPVA
jgi:uncharacterized membrane protein YdbT with pleckstrin-like domain